MNEEQIKQTIEIINEEGNKYDLDIIGFVDEDALKDIETKEDLNAYLESLNKNNEITNEDITYHSNAIRYLSEEDPSLSYSLEIAIEYGYSIDKLSSELLASLLKTRKNEEVLSECITSIVEQFNEEV